MIKRLKEKIKKNLLKFDKSTKYFSQGGEDAILRGILSNKIKSGKKGFYIDVGSYHPYIHSNTHHFYLKGWRGINIDPNPGLMEAFKKIRKRDINLEIGVGEENGRDMFYILDPASTMNSFSRENLEKHGMARAIKKELLVEVRTLECILDEYSDKFEEIDFLSVDVEGLDLKVLKSNNWSKYKPNVVIVELDCVTIEDISTNEAAQFLLKVGYEAVAKNVIMKSLASVVFVRKGYQY